MTTITNHHPLAVRLAGDLLKPDSPYLMELIVRIEHRPAVLRLAERDYEAAKQALIDDAVLYLRTIAGLANPARKAA